MEYPPSVSFLQEEQFLEYFPVPWEGEPPSVDEFVEQAIIQYSIPVSLKNVFELRPTRGRKKPIMKGPKDWRLINRSEIVRFFYDILVVNRDLYIREIFRSSFELMDPHNMKWDPAIDIRGKDPFSLSLQKNDASKILVKNLFHIELLHLTVVTNSVKSEVSFWQALTSMFTEFAIEDRFFAPSVLKLCMKPKRSFGPDTDFPSDFKTLYYQLQQYQPKASILNPYTVYWCLYHVLGNGKSLFTPVLSWGSYLIAFMHSTYEEYVGVDVMNSVCKKVGYLRKFYEILNPDTFGSDKKSVKLLCQKSESLLDDPWFLKEYYGRFDTILVCPPYFDMELYHEGDQSVSEYPEYEDWLTGYWENTVKVCKMVAKPGCKFGVIANNYNTLDGEFVALADDLDEITRKYFNVVDVYSLVNRASSLRAAAKDRTERLFVYTPSKIGLELKGRKPIKIEVN